MTTRMLLATAATGIAAALLPPGAAADTRVEAPSQALVGRSFTVSVTPTETGTATVSAGGVTLATAAVSAGTTTAILVTLSAPGTTRIDVSTGTSTASATVEATDFQVAPAVQGPPFAGFGGQFNQNVYAEISRADGVSETNVGSLERSLLALRPQFSRIFFNPAAFTDPDLMQSFVRTVLLAQRAGTTINVTWQGGTLDVKSGAIPKLADVLTDLVQRQHVTNLRWFTYQNEPNSTRITPAQYEAVYRALDPYLWQIRGQLRYMGGDLVQTNQRAWFDWFAAHTTDLFDAWSIHVFWDWWDTEKLEQRLTEVRQIVDSYPSEVRKPVYVAEYGVRGLRNWNGAPAGDPGVWSDGTQISETNVGAFQQAWFDLLAARLGFAGTSKWDLYFSRYDKATQSYYLLGGPKTGWPRHPLYNLLYLLTGTVRPGWHAAAVDQAPGTSRLVASFTGGGAWTLLGLDRAAAELNTPTGPLVPYSVGGLPPGTTFRLVIWNADGDGLDDLAGSLTADAAGVATFAVPQHAVFALTTLTGSLAPRPGFPRS